MTVSVTGVEFYLYRMPLTASFTWAFGDVKSVTNIITVLHGRGKGVVFKGIGESAPRGPRLTGDIWEGIRRTMTLAAERICGQSLPDSPDAYLPFIANLMSDLAASTAGHVGDAGDAKRFRGSLCGIEMALLDLVSRAQGMPVANLLGAKRSSVEVNYWTVAERLTDAQLAEKCSKRAERFPICRLKGLGGGVEANVHLLTRAADIYRQLGRPISLWIDINGALSGKQAREFVEQVSLLSRKNRLPEQLIIEQPVPRIEVRELASLQQQADTLAAAYGGKIIIMADESVWDRADLTALHQAGGCRAVNIKIQKAGGLIEAIRTAELAIAHNPDCRIQIGSFPGVSDVTAWAAINLGRAMPRLDYFGGVPPQRVKQRIATPLCRFVTDGSALLEQQAGPGLGVEIDGAAIRPFIRASFRMPTQAGSWITAYQKLIDEDALAHSSVEKILRATFTSLARPFTVLDIGCGDAQQMKRALLGSKVHRYYGIDVSETALKLAAQHLKNASFEVRLEQGRMLQLLSRPRDRVDATWCGLSIHHLKTSAKAQLFARLRSLTREFVLIYEPTCLDEENRPAYLERFRRINREQWGYLTREEWIGIENHVAANDFPETAEAWRRLGYEAGFCTVTELFCDPTGFYRMYRYDVNSG